MGQTNTDKLLSPIVGKAITTEFDLDARNDALETQAKRQRIINVAAGAEAADVIALTFTVTAGDGTAINTPVNLKLSIYSDEVLDAVVAKAAFTLADGGAGSLVAQAAANAVYTFQTTAAGSLEVNVTDVAGASGLTRYIKAELIALTVPANTWATTAVRQTVIFD
jgi:hypothetical protein